MSRSPGRPARSITCAGALVLAAAALVACSGEDDTAADLAERASAGLTGAYTATYRLESAPTVDLREDAADVRVWRSPGSLRLDVTTGKGVARSITTAEGVVACQTNPRGVSTCLDVAGPGEVPRPEFYPALNHVFTGMLDVFADDDAGLELSEADDSDAARLLGDAPVEDAVCVRVGGEPPSPVTVGTYCLGADGVPVAAEFTSGRLRLTALDRAAPAAGEFAPPVSPTPLPS